jgi:hypothetical protein
MKRRTLHPPFSAAELRELNRYEFSRILKALKWQDYDEARASAERGLSYNTDRRIAAAARASRHRQLRNNARLIRSILELNTKEPGGLTVARVQKYCADKGDEFDRMTVTNQLDRLGLRKADRRGRPRLR